MNLNSELRRDLSEITNPLSTWRVTTLPLAGDLLLEEKYNGANSQHPQSRSSYECDLTSPKSCQKLW
jgi:hypothetical protein